MAATSRHYGDVYKWLEKVIDSCNSQWQEYSAGKLITLFGEGLRRNEEADRYFIHEMERSLNDKLDYKMYLVSFVIK